MSESRSMKRLRLTLCSARSRLGGREYYARDQELLRRDNTYYSVDDLRFPGKSFCWISGPSSCTVILFIVLGVPRAIASEASKLILARRSTAISQSFPGQFPIRRTRLTTGNWDWSLVTRWNTSRR